MKGMFTMRRTMNVWIVVAVCACVMVGFFCYNNTLNATLKELDATYNAATVRLNTLRAEKTDLEEELQTVGTDAFIENQARTMYGYMMPDEIRFVITNPEVLYGDEEIPSR